MCFLGGFVNKQCQHLPKLDVQLQSTMSKFTPLPVDGGDVAAGEPGIKFICTPAISYVAKYVVVSFGL